MTRDYFAYLGVFAPKPATFDLDALRSVWELIDPTLIARELVDRGLLAPVPPNRFSNAYAVGDASQVALTEA